MCRVSRQLPPPIQLPDQAAMMMGPPSLNLPPMSIDQPLKTTATSKTTMTSRSSTVYELGPILREGRFGSIRFGFPQQKGVEKTHNKTDNAVILKVYSLELMREVHTSGSAAVENPWSEIEIQQLIGQKAKECSHLVGIVETSIVGQSLYLVLPYYRGGDLFDLLESRFQGPMPSALAKRMFLHLIKGLAALHQLGIAHRDISLENVLVDQSEEEQGGENFAICDFGMAVRVPRDPLTGAFLPLLNAPACGKEGYIAPCLWKRAPAVDAFACDIWSAGVVLFMALTGSAPMQRAVEWDPYYQMICNHQLIEMLGEELMIDLEGYQGLELVQSILNPDPSQRPTANDLLTHPWLSSM